MTHLSKMEGLLTRQFFDDGLLDMFVGVGLALIGIAWLSGLLALGAIVPAVMMPFWKPLRQKLAEPHIGTVDFSDSHKNKGKEALTKWVAFGIVVLVVEVSALFAFNRVSLSSLDFLKDLVPALPSVLIAIPLTATALYLKIGRFALYGTLSVFFGFILLVDTGINLEPGHAILFTGVCTALIGFGAFRHFLQNAREMDAEG